MRLGLCRSDRRWYYYWEILEGPGLFKMIITHGRVRERRISYVKD